MELQFPYDILVPEYLIASTAAVVAGLGLTYRGLRSQHLAYMSVVGLLIALAVSLLYINENRSFANLIRVDNYATLFRVFFILISVFVCLASARYAQRYLINHPEYYGIIVLSTIGMIYMAAAEELLTAYIALELLSFSLYVLTSYAKLDPKSNEGGLKYMLLGAFSSAVFLYGLSIIYGITGTTSYAGIAEALSGDVGDRQTALLIGLVMIVAGLGFKVSAVPFHMWTPDAYEGAPLPVTAFISAASKAAGFALFIRLFAGPFLPILDDWRWMLAGLAAATMVTGNLVALQQHNLKRLLAYSSIGQVGYMVMGIAAFSPDSTAAASAIVLHLIGYVISNLVLFLGIIYFYDQTGKDEIEDLRGLAETNPFLAASMTAALFSLAGLPLFAGFATKFILFQAAAEQNLLWLAGTAVLMSFVSLYYYLMVIKQMYIVAPERPGRLAVPGLDTAVLALLTLGVFVVGLYPFPLFRAIERSTDLILILGQAATVASP